MEKDNLVQQAILIIDDLKNECSSGSIVDLEETIDKFNDLCSETLGTREDLFVEASGHLDNIEKDCPKSIVFIDKLRDLIKQGEGLKCGGP